MIEARKFVFTVSLCAMLAVNPVLANEVSNPADLGTPHTVYDAEKVDGMVESGIAGVQYVNRMVHVAGNAAQNAERHAASAGDSAYKAAGSAEDAQGAADKAADDAAKAAASAEAANEALSTKLDNAWGADKKNLAMVTDDKGTVYPGYISTDMIADKAVTAGKMSSNGALPGHTLMVTSGSTGFYVGWGQVVAAGIENGAVKSDKIADGAVSADKISSYGTSGVLASGVLVVDGNGGAGWGQIGTTGIVDGAVTVDKIAERAVTADKMNAYGGGVGNTLLVASGATGMYVYWGDVTNQSIADGAVTWGKIAEGAVRSDNISGGSVTANKMSASGALPGQVLVPEIVNGNFTTGVVWGQVGSAGIAPGAVRADNMFSSGEVAGFALLADGNAGAEWGQVGTSGIEDGAVTSDKIADGAVTREKTNGIVGVIPVGSATNPTSYGSFWIE